MKEARVAHAVAAYEDDIYVFGGKGVKSLEVFNVKSKTSSVLAEHKQ